MTGGMLEYGRPVNCTSTEVKSVRLAPHSLDEALKATYLLLSRQVL
jgi:hypothetical protein